ncbi:MAG: NADH-quinone oxidoreductase subunit L [Elusimicrobiota bacterium]|nr:MAG: NADH-quinone oxidoreductase subunit L [Elusimicrobiota bacterium]
MTPSQVPLAAWLLFAAPVSAILFGFFVMRRWKPELTHVPILLSCAVVTASAFALCAQVLSGHMFDVNFFRWAEAGTGPFPFGVDFGLRVDGPGVAVLTMVAFVGSLIHVYAAAYMKGDPGFSRFFLVFHLFFLAMIGLLTSNNFVQLYLFWELVGVASYLLVGFWYHKESARAAALKAFMTNRVGDFGLLLAVLVIGYQFNVTHFHLIYLKLISGAKFELLPLIGVCLVWAACAKSAQFPLYFWLPDAMEGPTPTSALMHAATMVTAGVFLLVRSWPLIAAVEGLPHLIAWIGAFTALFAAVIAGSKKDLKRILAYSTVSHLGLMMMALGLGQVGASVFHLVVHGFFKAALFLCAGNIAHALHQSTANVDDVGGLSSSMRLTYLSFLLAALSLAGVPPFGGFWSKDAILDAAWHHGGAMAVMGMLVAAGSAFYIFRMLFLVFYGARPEQKRAPHAHEAEPMLGVPVLFLALGAVCAGLLKAPLLAFAELKSPFERLMVFGLRGLPAGLPELQGMAFDLPGQPTLPHLNMTVALIGTAMAALGAFAAWRLTMSDPGFDWRWRGGRLERAFESDFGWKIVVGRLVAGVSWCARFSGRVLDKAWWDGLIEGSADAARGAGGLLASTARGRVNDYLWWLVAGSAILMGRVLR